MSKEQKTLDEALKCIGLLYLKNQLLDKEIAENSETIRVLKNKVAFATQYNEDIIRELEQYQALKKYNPN